MHQCKVIQTRKISIKIFKLITYINIFRIGCEFQNGCPSEICRADERNDGCEEESGTNTDNDPQILRHLVFLILLLCSMFIVCKLLNIIK